ncbi:MAG: hypothetical protein RL434_1847 [Pseudomonadota bacterium]
MYTQCPECEGLFQIRAQTLRVAMGMIRCTHCGLVFNALAELRDEEEVAGRSFENIGESTTDESPGDRLLIDADVRSGETRILAAGPHVTSAPTDRAPSPQLARPPGTATESRGGSTRLAWLRTLLGQTGYLALRNLSRHRRRTALALCATGFGVAALLIAGGFAEWMMWIGRESTIHSRLGHLQIVRQGYYEGGVADPRAYLVSSEVVDTAAITRLPHVEALGERLNFAGLASLEDTTVSFLGEGVTPETEADLAREIVIDEGRALSADDSTGVILGKGLANSLGARVGATLVLLGTDQDGGVSAVDAKVRGIFHTAVKAYDDVTLRTPLALAQRLMKVEGAHQWLILLDETERTEELLPKVQALLGQDSGLQLLPWIDLADFHKAVVKLFEAQTRFVNGVIALIIVMSISSLLGMSVMERTAEIGTLLAFGIPRRRVMQLFVTEGLILGVLGGGIGLAGGWLVAELISHIGIPMPPAPGMDHGFTAFIRLTPGLAGGGFVLAVVSAGLASLYPAWKASRLEIVDALRRAR